MNYTPNDLQNMEITKAVVRGYKEDAVNEILDKVIEDYNRYIRENIELKDKVVLLNEAIQNYKSMENSMQNALIVAQQVGEEVKKNAYDKAETIIKEAELKAVQRMNEISDQTLKIKLEYEEIKKKFFLYKNKFESLLSTQMELIKQSSIEEGE